MWQAQTWTSRKGIFSPLVYHWIITSLTCRSHGPSITDWVKSLSQVSLTGNLPIWMWFFNLMLFIVCDKVTEEYGEIFKELAKEGGSLFWNNVNVSMLFSQHINWNLIAILQELYRFDLDHSSLKNNNNEKKKTIKAFEVLK